MAPPPRRPRITNFTPETIAAYLDGELTPEERRDFEAALERHPEWRTEIADQAEMKAALGRLRVRPPKAEVWDRYWEEIDQQLPRRVVTSTAILGAGVLGLAGLAAIAAYLNAPVGAAAPALLAIGVILFVLGTGGTFLLALKGRLAERRRDRYRRIRR